MRLVLDPRARRWLRRMPRYSPYSIAELLLLALLAVQCARLVWVIATPVDPLGDWRPTARADVPDGIFRSFDPFFRGGVAAGPAVVTTLDLKLFGIRSDQATGRGSAIVGTPDGNQASYAVGENILPGVSLAAVGFDNVTILRGGAREQIFLDQSRPATMVSPVTANIPPAGALSVPAPAVVPGGDVQLTPRLERGRVTGFVVDQQGAGESLRTFGFQPGDVVVAVDGIAAGAASPEQIRNALARNGGDVTAQVQRDGRTITLTGTYNR